MKKHKVGHVYLVRNLVNGKMYVGQTVKPIERRWYEHVKAAECRTGFYLHNAIMYYGAERFTIESVWCGSVIDMAKMECKFIKDLVTQAPHGYNLTAGGEGTPNPSARTRRKLSIAHKGRKRTDAEKAAMSAVHTGSVHTAAHNAKISKANKRFWEKRAVEDRLDVIDRLHTPEAIKKREAKLKASGAHVGDAQKAEKCRAASMIMWTDKTLRAKVSASQRRAWARKSEADRTAVFEKVWETRRALGKVRAPDASYAKGWATRRANALKKAT